MILKLQVVVGKCLTYIAFTLEYGGPFQCKPVIYITAGCGVAVIILVFGIIIFCKYKANKGRLRARGQQPGHNGVPIPSVYPLMPYPLVSVLISLQT